MVAMRGGTSGGDDFQVFAARLALRICRQQQQRAGVALRSLGQARQRQVGHRGHVGRLGQLEGQAASFAAARPIFETPLSSSSSPGARSFVFRDDA